MPKITPCLWFDTEGEDAARFYTSVFPNSRIMDVARYGEAGPRDAGTVMAVSFELDGQEFVALNGGPEFTFDEAISFQIDCADQEEVDRYTDALTVDGEQGPCGWVKDRFGLSWQVVPARLFELLGDPDEARPSARWRRCSRCGRSTSQRSRRPPRAPARRPPDPPHSLRVRGVGARADTRGVRRRPDGRLELSPSDLSAYLACPHLTTLALEVAHGERARPYVREALAELVAREGRRSTSSAYLEHLRATGTTSSRSSCRRSRARSRRRTRRRSTAMRAGADVIYQATFARDGWRGRADFVVRVDEPSDLGAWSYEPYDTKLARSAKPAAVLQLAWYADEIAAVQGRMPERLHVVLGTSEIETLPARRRRRLPASRAAAAARARRASGLRPIRGRASTARAATSSRVCRERWRGRRPPDARRVDPTRPDRASSARSA